MHAAVHHTPSLTRLSQSSHCQQRPPAAAAPVQTSADGRAPAHGPRAPQAAPAAKKPAAPAKKAAPPSDEDDSKDEEEDSEGSSDEEVRCEHTAPSQGQHS